MLCNDIQRKMLMFSEEKLCQARQKLNKVLVKYLFTQTQLTIVNKKKYISKLSIKMFIKRKTRAGKIEFNRMLVG